MDTSQATPPPNAMVLFGGKDLANWRARDGGEPGWQMLDGVLQVTPGTGDIVSRERFRDFFLHLEFRCPWLPQASGQARANSGVYVQGRYELQILDSEGVETPGTADCGAVYGLAPPLINASRPALVWQTYDVVFRAPRTRHGQPEPARITVLQNGLVIHNNLPLPTTTAAALDTDVRAPGPVLLQDHGNAIGFRNIWAVPLPARDEAAA